MTIELRDTELCGDEPRGLGLALLLTGEAGDKHPELRIAVFEKDMPGIRAIWNQGRSAEFLSHLGTPESIARHERLWEQMLTLDNPVGERARAIKERVTAPAQD